MAEKEVVLKKYSALRNIIIFLDMLVAILIIMTATKISAYPLGKSALVFGFVMVAVVTILKILDKI